MFDNSRIFLDVGFPFLKAYMSIDACTPAEFVNRLGNLCLSVGAHRNYLQRHVEQLEVVERQSRRDHVDIENIEEQLSKAIASAERVATMSHVLEAARRNNAPAGQQRFAAQVQSPQQNSSVTSTTSMADILRFSKAAESFDGEAGATSAIMTHVDTAQAQVARLDYKLRTRTLQSVRSKLARLEALKASCRDIDVAQCLEDSFSTFRYSPEAEAMFYTSSPSHSIPQSREKGMRVAPQPPVTATTQGNEQDDGAIQKDPTPHDRRLVRSSNVAHVLQGAVERLTLRYADALNALVQSGTSFIADQPNTDVDRLLYAAGFSQLLADESSDSVQFASYLRATVQNPTLALQQEYDALCKRWVATSKISRSHGGIERGSAWNSIINAEPHVVLPASLATVSDDGNDVDAWSKLLSTLPLHNEHAPPLLPPAKHIITQRFSAVDVAELQSLERLRMRLQQSVVESRLQLPVSVAEQLPRLSHDWQRTVLGGSNRADGGTWTVLAKTEQLDAAKAVADGER
jgi:hypothetical protein